MIKVKSASQLILEATGAHKRKYGCMMTTIEFDDSAIKDIFEDADLCKDEGGYENEHHVTNLYGLHDSVDADDVIGFCQRNSNFRPFTLNAVSYFTNEKEGFNVLKFDVSEGEFYKLNKMLRLKFPHTLSYPNYHAHATIAYVNIGTAEKYLPKLKNLNIEAKVTGFCYSSPDGKKKKAALD